MTVLFFWGGSQQCETAWMCSWMVHEEVTRYNAGPFDVSRSHETSFSSCWNSNWKEKPCTSDPERVLSSPMKHEVNMGGWKWSFNLLQWARPKKKNQPLKLLGGTQLTQSPIITKQTVNKNHRHTHTHAHTNTRERCHPTKRLHSPLI